MKSLKVVTGAIVFITAGQAAAICSDESRLTITAEGNAISDHLAGNTVCGTGVGASAGDQWQEYHGAGGTLTEIAKLRDPVDPMQNVGIWSTSGMGDSSEVVYNYDGGGSFSFSVHVDGGTTYFCSGGSEVVSAIVMGGKGACGF